jgi:hypothetical protein
MDHFAASVERYVLRQLTSRRVVLVALVAGVLLLNAGLRLVDDIAGTSLAEMVSGARSPRAGEFSCQRDYADNVGGGSVELQLCPEPIDAVYTWVNGSELMQKRLVAFWQARQAREDQQSIASGVFPPSTDSAHSQHARNHSRHNRTGDHHGNAADGSRDSTTALEHIPADQAEDQSSASRFEDHDEMLYSLRSLERFAPWVRRVYIVTNGQVPTWLNLDHPRVRVVPHSAIFPDASHLPTFSSPAIEAHLHRIQGLSRRFLYLNDDTFFASPVQPDDFYSPTKGHRIYFSWPVPNCAPGCPNTWLNDGFCDRACNTSDCDWDNGDCLKEGAAGKGAPSGSMNRFQSVGGQPAVPASPAITRDPEVVARCAANCPDVWLGDRHCDAPCNIPECGFDVGDCSAASLHRLPSLNNATGTSRRRRAYTVEAGVPAFTVELSGWYGPRTRIVDGDYEEHATWIRSVTIIDDLKLMVVTLRRSITQATLGQALCRFRVHGVIPGAAPSLRTTANNATNANTPDITIAASFNITCRVPPPVTTHAPARRNATSSGNKDNHPPSVAEEQQGPTPEAPMQRHPQLLKRSETPPPASIDETMHPQLARLRELQEQQRGEANEARRQRHGPRGREHRKKSMGDRKLLQLEDLASEEARLETRLGHQKELDAENDALREETDWTAALAALAGLHPTANPAAESFATRRRLLDMFGDSLKFGNRLLSAKFGASTRKVPAHMVHMIDKDVVDALWETWPAEFNETSQSKFRSKRNVQYGFMHFYYIIHARRKWTPEAFFDEMVDLNRDGVIDKGEERRVALLLFEKGVNIEQLARRIAEEQDGGNLTINATTPPAIVVPRSVLSRDKARFAGRGRSMLQVTEAVAPPPPTPVANSEAVVNNNARKAIAVLHVNQTRVNRTVAVASGVPTVASTQAPPPTAAPPYVYTPAPPRNADDLINPLTRDFVALVRVYIEEFMDRGEELAEALESSSTSSSASATADSDSRSNVGGGSGSSNVVNHTSRFMTRGEFIVSPLADWLMSLHPQSRFRYTLEDQEDITFFMVRDNATVVRHQMDHVLYKRNKFICINDNMNHSHVNHSQVVGVIHDFFSSYFPKPSTFERPNGERNAFTRLNDDELAKVYAGRNVAWNFSTSSIERENTDGRSVSSTPVASLWFVPVALGLLCLVTCFTAVRGALRRRRRRQPHVMGRPVGARGERIGAQAQLLPAMLGEGL